MESSRLERLLCTRGAWLFSLSDALDVCFDGVRHMTGLHKDLEGTLAAQSDPFAPEARGDFSV